MNHPTDLVAFYNMQADGHMLLPRSSKVSFYIYLNPEAGYTLPLSLELMIWRIIA